MTRRAVVRGMGNSIRVLLFFASCASDFICCSSIVTISTYFKFLISSLSYHFLQVQVHKPFPLLAVYCCLQVTLHSYLQSRTSLSKANQIIIQIILTAFRASACSSTKRRSQSHNPNTKIFATEKVFVCKIRKF